MTMRCAGCRPHHGHASLHRAKEFVYAKQAANRLPLHQQRYAISSTAKQTHMQRLSTAAFHVHCQKGCGWNQCDFRFDLFLVLVLQLFFRFRFSFANNQIISNLLTKTC